MPVLIPHAADIRACAVAAGVDDCLAISSDGKAYGWGFSVDYRTGLGTEETVGIARPLKDQAFAGKKLNFAACGGQFSLLTGAAL